ncbi:hypothetical protein BDZ89DRAFT_1066713 [Hymenopellis radicata]|nr:hypothetical protein BDZ89DRAFT_1066713 [Hymenopellis radicata]
MAFQDSVYSRLPLEIKSSIIDELDDADLGAMALVWPETLATIRRRTFNSVVISHRAHHCEDHADEAYRRIQSSLCNLRALLESTPDISRYIRVLHLRESTLGWVPRFPISRHTVLSEFLGFVPEMRNLERLILEGLNFWMMDPKALPRALRRCTFSLHTLQLKACVIPMDILVVILRAVVDVHLLDIGTLQFDRFKDWNPHGLNDDEYLLYINETSHPLVDFDDPAAWKHTTQPPDDREFFCADTLRLHIMSPADHRFVFPLCDVRVLQISNMSALGRMRKYLEELTIFQANRAPIIDANLFINLSYISTFKFWTHIKCWTYEPVPGATRYRSPTDALEMYTSALHGLSETTNLRHVEVNLVLDVDMKQETLPSAAISSHAWSPLDAALTASVLTRKLEDLVLNVLLMDDLEYSEVARLEGWILNECLPATRRTYFETDERGVIFCEKR